MNNDYLDSVKKQFQYYKMLGDKTFAQLNNDAFFWQYNEDSNSIAMIVNHLSGNMLSRFTDFLTTDGEKEWRNRDLEFEPQLKTKAAVIEKWEQGWTCLFEAINPLTANDLDRIIYIRNQGHTVTEAINRQLAHYPYHIGQIVMLGKMLAENGWQSLSIPKGRSQVYNADKFAKPQQKAHFTDEFLDKSKYNA
ncbi:MAG: DUF1572 domain-containing protein [Pedobacter sp.]|uniref:DUF1572 domain-containing protein n=1 Tax=Pedobacter sp. TaxID=1411316 RepID=UPI0028078FB3|nr:DUF1572 domain-containing protein [Pedobacter sp.]MDQ8003234.1 DUF1572 domain-containing protein [Pedobacter sp.]